MTAYKKGTTQGSENLTDMLDPVIKWSSHCAASRVAWQLKYTKLNEGKMSHRYSKRKIDKVFIQAFGLACEVYVEVSPLCSLPTMVCEVADSVVCQVAMLPSFNSL